MSPIERVDHPYQIKNISDEGKIVFEQFDYSFENIVRPNLDKWQAAYEAYRSYVQQSDVTSGLFRPTIFSSIESFVPKFGADQPTVQVWGRGREDELRAAINRQLIFYDWDVTEMILQGIIWAKTALIYGIGWAKAHYRRESYEKVLRDGREAVYEYDGPDLEILDPDEVFPSHAKTMKDVDYVIHRVPVDFYQLEAARFNGKPLYIPARLKELETLMGNANPIQCAKYDTLRKRRREVFDDGKTEEEPTEPHRQQLHLLEKTTRGKIVTVVEEFPQLKPIRANDNPYGIINYACYTPTLLPQELVGLSHPEILYSLAMEMNTLAIARMDTVLQQAYPMLEILKGVSLKPDDVVWRPRGWYFTDVPNATRFVEPPRLDGAPYREFDDLRMWMQLAGGDTDIFKGLSSDLTGGTATEATLLSQASGSRAGLMLQVYGLQALKRLGRIWIRMHETMMSNPMKLRILGEDFGDILGDRIQEGALGNYLTVTPEDLQSREGIDLNLKLDIAAAEPATRQVRLAQATNAFSILREILPPDHPFMEELLTLMGRGFGFERMDKILKDGRAVAKAFSLERRAPLTKPAETATVSQ